MGSNDDVSGQRHSDHQGGDDSAATLTPDLLFKMSKKIAQLTKVIYFLNTQMEDYEIREKTAEGTHQQQLKEVGAPSISFIGNIY